MQPEFEEKSFESAANGELRLISPHFYAPGQVAEGILGFDIASFQPATAPIWNYLQMAAPGGLRLLPNFWPTGGQPALDVRLPNYVISLVVQYKRAERMLRSNALQYDHWGTEYYRFKLDEDQQVVLEQFESAVHNYAAIRYGSPAFYRFDDLEQHTLSGQVLANTNFVSPLHLVGHEAWTYLTPGTQGYANPDPKRIKAESWDVLRERLRTARRQTTVIKHLREMASAITSAQIGGQAKVPDTLNVQPTRLEADQQQALSDLLTVSRIIGRLGSEWWISVEPVNATKAK